MHDKEVINHLERKLVHLKNHVTEQDTEIFKLSRLVDALSMKVQKMEKLFRNSGLESPIDRDSDPGKEGPPHY